MAEIETPAEPTNFTHVWMRRMEQKVDSGLETLTRQESRLGRVERDAHELKGGMILMENRLLNNVNAILRVVERGDEAVERIGAHQSKFESIETRLDTIDGKLDELLSATR